MQYKASDAPPEHGPFCKDDSNTQQGNQRLPTQAEMQKNYYRSHYEAGLCRWSARVTRPNAKR